MASVKYATAFVHGALFLLIGSLLAVIYLFERVDIDEWVETLAPDSIAGTGLRWLGYEGRTFDNRDRALQRLGVLVARLERW